MTIRLNLALAAAAASLWIGAAQAQSVMTPGAVPPPPSLRDSTAPTEGGAAKRRARRAEGAEAGSEAASPRRKLRAPGAASATPGASGEGYSTRIDSRVPRESGRMQMEDDPRAVQPVMNNGRAGMGMRF
jgi:hypothetical protein